MVELIQVVLSRKDWPVRQHLRQDATHWPDVYGLSVALKVRHTDTVDIKSMSGLRHAQGHEWILLLDHLQNSETIRINPQCKMAIQEQICTRRPDVCCSHTGLCVCLWHIEAHQQESVLSEHTEWLKRHAQYTRFLRQDTHLGVEHDFRGSVPTGGDILCEEPRVIVVGISHTSQTKIADLQKGKNERRDEDWKPVT